MTLEEQINHCLVKSEMTKTELAKKLGTTQSAFSQRLGRGKFTKEELEKIAACLDCNYHSYFEYDDGTVY